jgi:putative endonuclease
MCFHYVYVLRSLADGNFYVGMTNDLRARVALHESGKVESTKRRRPFILIYYESCRDIRDAVHREKYLKSAWGKRFIKMRLRHYLTAG